MQKYKYVFVVLVYKNIDDLVNLIPQIQELPTEKAIIIVDNYSTEKVRTDVKKFASDYNCILLENENTGYSAGNNLGIKYALDNLDFEFLIVNNADIDIIRFNVDKFDTIYKKAVVAPVIKNKRKKNQNPYWYKTNKLAEIIIYAGLKNNIKVLFYLGCAIFKLQREIFLFRFRFSKGHYHKVAAAHGSFTIFSRHVLDTIGLPYDENMFLFGEEALLGHKLKREKIDVYFTDDIEIYHHEDGSIRNTNLRQIEETRKSTIYYYEKVYQKKGLS